MPNISGLTKDNVAYSVMPLEYKENGFSALKSYGDGNSLFCSTSILICGDETKHPILYCIELCYCIHIDDIVYLFLIFMVELDCATAF